VKGVFADVGILDHIGIAVRSLAESLPFYTQTLGLTSQGPEEVASEGVRVAFLQVGESRLELLEPLSDDSPIARFLSKRGPGVHHFCLRVADMDRALAALRSRGAEVIPPEHRIGAGGRRVAFIHPRSTGGILMELKEYRRE